MPSPRALLAVAVSIALLSLTSCSSGTSGSTNALTGTPVSSANPTTAPSPATLLYGINPTAGVIDIYSATASGNAPPPATLSVPTGFTPLNLITDNTAQLYVAGTTSTSAEVLVYPAAATGTTAPTRTLTLSTTPVALAVDNYGLLYVLNSGDPTASISPSVNIYPEGASGSMVPTRTIQFTGAATGFDIAVDSAQNVYVQGYLLANGIFSTIIEEFSSTATGAATPTRTLNLLIQTLASGITLTGYENLAVDDAGDIFVRGLDANVVPSNPFVLLEYGPSATGNAVPTVAVPDPSPQVSTSLGSYTYAGSIRRDASGRIYTLSALGYSPSVGNTPAPGYIFTASVYAYPLTSNSVPIFSSTQTGWSWINNVGLPFGVN